jgi:hypothetical protein
MPSREKKIPLTVTPPPGYLLVGRKDACGESIVWPQTIMENRISGSFLKVIWEIQGLGLFR